jgi:sterol desaturase/sphingolipid hydroxylase (fatty acid hydroxylase superfamily)
MFDYIIIPFLVHITTYWSLSFIFYLLDLKYLEKNHVNWLNYKKAAKCSFINQIMISFPTIYFTEKYIILAVEKSCNDSNSTILFKIFIIVNMANFLFYIFHRLFHTKILFKLLHYKHHEFIEPIAVAALYSNPIEHLFANTLSFLIPFYIVGVPYYTMLFLLCSGSCIVVFSHINYRLVSDEMHLIHHKLFRYNYGFISYLDKIFGTYKIKNEI